MAGADGMEVLSDMADLVSNSVCYIHHYLCAAAAQGGLANHASVSLVMPLMAAFGPRETERHSSSPERPDYARNIGPARA